MTTTTDPTETTTDLPTVVQALSAAMDDIGAVRKDQINQHQRFNFRGVDAVVNAASPAFRRHGIVVAPTVLEKELHETKTAKGAVMANVYLTVRYDFYGPRGDSISATVASESFDSGDKATAKAMSVAFRTALLQTLALPTDEIDDPDHVTYERAGAAPTPTRREAEAPDLTPPSPGQVDQLASLVHDLQLDEPRLEAAAKWATRRRGAAATGDVEQLTRDEMGELVAFLESKIQPAPTLEEPQ